MKYILLLLSVLSIAPFVSSMSSDRATRSQQNETAKKCSNCDAEQATKACGACKVVYYCSQTCQRHDWSKHKAACKNVAPRAPQYVVPYQEPIMLSREMSAVFERAFQASGKTISLSSTEKALLDNREGKSPVRASSRLEDALHKAEAGLKVHINESEFYGDDN